MRWNIVDKKYHILQLKSKLGLSRVVPTSPKTPPEEHTLTVVEMQELPDIEKNWLQIKYFLPKMDNIEW